MLASSTKVLAHARAAAFLAPTPLAIVSAIVLADARAAALFQVSQTSFTVIQ
jgi:hypothetical protein